MESLDLSLRQRKILHIIEQHPSYLTSKSLAASLNVSSRTIRNDIYAMNEILEPYHASIHSTQSKGFLFEAEDPALIRELCRIDAAFYTRSDRVRYLTTKVCLSDEPINLYDLEDELFVGHSTILTDLAEMKRRYSHSEPYLRFILKRNDLTVERDELKLRSVLLNLMHGDWDYNSKGNAYYGSDFLDKELLAVLMHETSSILFRNGILLDDPTLVALELTLAIMDHRVRSGHPFPEGLPAPDPATSAGKATTELLALMSSHTDFSYPETEAARINQFLENAGYQGTEWLMPEDAGLPYSPEVIERADRYLALVKDTYGVDFSHDPGFMQALRLFLGDLKKGQSIFSQHQNYRAIKEALVAEYELAVLFQELAPEYIDRHLTEIELSNLALGFSGAIRHYLSLHPGKKLRAVLFCHRSFMAAWELSRRLMETFSLYLDITRILPVNFKGNFDFSSVDLILSTVSKRFINTPFPVTIRIDDTPGADPVREPARIKQLSFKNVFTLPNFSLTFLFSHARWYENVPPEDRFRIIEILTNDCVSDGVADEAYQMDIMQRESLDTFAIKPGLIFLYSHRPAKETRLSIMTTAHRVDWCDQRISTVVLATLREQDRNLLFPLKILFCTRTYDPEILRKRKTKRELLPYLMEQSSW